MSHESAATRRAQDEQDWQEQQKQHFSTHADGLNQFRKIDKPFAGCRVNFPSKQVNYHPGSFV
jgi:hypothetical protein